jgi:hypothetical protein
LLRYRFLILASIESKERDPQYPLPGSPLDRAWICDRVLFLDGDFTNIDFIRFIATATGLLFVCILSFAGKVDVKKCRTCIRNYYQRLLDFLNELLDEVLHRLDRLFTFFAKLKILIGDIFRLLSGILRRNDNFARTWSEAARQRFLSSLAHSENELADLRSRLG